MRYLAKLWVIVILFPVCTVAKPFDQLVRDYSQGTIRVSGEAHSIAEAIEDSFPGVLASKSFDYEKFENLRLEILQVIETSMPGTDILSKSVRVNEHLVNTDSVDSLVSDFEFFLIKLTKIASMLKAEHPQFLPDYAILEEPDDLKHWEDWHDAMGEILDLEIEESLRRFEIKYGVRSDKLNFMEFILLERFPPFRGNTEGPTAWEPILRFTPAYYNFAEGKFIKAASAGLTYYFFGGSNVFLRFLQDYVHHFGVAFVFADIESKKIYEWNRAAYGAEVHLGKCQVGVIKDRDEDEWKVISTVNFQIVPLGF